MPGKVNLYLDVGDRRDDGYHELTTVFHAVSLLDEVTVRAADVLSAVSAGRLDEATAQLSETGGYTTACRALTESLVDWAASDR